MTTMTFRPPGPVVHVTSVPNDPPPPSLLDAREVDGELRITDGRGRSAWFTPMRDDTRPAVIAEVCVDDDDHLVEVGRAELLALREWVDQQLARHPVGEVIDPQP
jgi:hypothetical protein